MAKIPKSVALSDLQLAVVRVLWQRGSAGTSEIVDALSDARGLAHTTVATVLSRLEKRGVVASKREGRQLVYCARVSEGAVRKSMVAGLVSTLFGGDARALVAHLVREDEIAPGDLAKVRKLLQREAAVDD
jgi:predicted transcriptional regulator